MKIKESLIIYLPQRIVLFPLDEYVDTLLVKTLNKLYDWDLLSKKKITGKEKYFKFFLEKEILDVLSDIKNIYKNLNLKIFTFYKNPNISSKNLIFLSEDNQVLELILKLFKKICKKYFLKVTSGNLKFNPSTKIFKGIKCGEPTGEEIEFLNLLLKKHE